MSSSSYATSLYAILKLGAQLHWIESVIGYLLFLPYFVYTDKLKTWFLWNASIQLIVFVPIALIPAWVTRKMFYVDLAWPIGVTAIGMQVLFYSYQGDWKMTRTTSIGTALTLHGARMALGALVVFFPYRLPQDLPRYQYAKLRFQNECGSSRNAAFETLWLCKLTHDLLQQCFANAAVLGMIGALAVIDTTESLSVLEKIGYLVWFVSWIWESLADIQKAFFDYTVKNKMPKDQKYVLGQAPFDGYHYSLWTLSRHPNYFGEWMAWVGLCLSVVPCVFRLPPRDATNESFFFLFQASLLMCLGFVLRSFYDCLLYWTGAGPAEHFSHQKRGALYERYQMSTRVFFPFPLPIVNHAQVPGWSTLTDPKK